MLKANRISVLGFLILLGACGGGGSDSNNQPGDPAPALGGVLASGVPPGFVAADSQAFAVAVTWEKAPVALSLNNRAIVRFLSVDGLDIEATLTRFSLYHATMGHGSIRESEMRFTQLEPGVWAVDSVYFSMGGAKSSWVVDVEAQSAGRSGKARVSIDHEIL